MIKFTINNGNAQIPGSREFIPKLSSKPPNDLINKAGKTTDIKLMITTPSVIKKIIHVRIPESRKLIFDSNFKISIPIPLLVLIQINLLIINSKKPNYGN